MFFDVSSLYTFKLDQQEGRFNPWSRQQAVNDVQVLEKEITFR